MARKWEAIPFKSRSIKSSLKVLSSSLVISCLSSQVFAAGFQIQEQNASQLGLAYSGTAAIAEDASTGFWNAAGLSRIRGTQIVGSMVGIFGSFDYDASRANSSIPNIAATGTNDDAASPATVPSFHVATRFNDRWVLGFDVNVPFGLTTEYDNDSVARYVATKSKLEAWNFGTSLAYEVLPCMSLGAGVDALWGKAALQANIGANGFGGSVDGYQHNAAEGWAFGFHAGILWQVMPSTRLGLSYRSKINLHAEGDSEIVTTPAGAAVQVFSVRRVQTQVALPESLIFSLYHEFAEQFALTGDVHWTNWSRTDVLGLRFSPPVASGPGNQGIDTNTDLLFKDTIRVALGLIYNYDHHWSFRIGGAFDESPVRDEHRIARLPDEDRWWLGLGAAYTLNPQWRFDVGYAHLFFKDAHLEDNGPRSISGAPISAAHLTADFNSSANILGVQFRYDFV